MKCIDMTTEFAKAPNFFGMGQRSRSSLLSQVQEARQKRGIPRPAKTNIVPESDSKHCKSTIVCLKDFLEGLLVTCAAFQHALSSVYCSISFTRDLHCEPSQVCQRLRAAFTRHLHPHPWKAFGTMKNINIKTHSEKYNLLGCSTSSSSDSFPPAILQCQSPLLVVLMSVGSRVKGDFRLYILPCCSLAVKLTGRPRAAICFISSVMAFSWTKFNCVYTKLKSRQKHVRNGTCSETNSTHGLIGM